MACLFERKGIGTGYDVRLLFKLHFVEVHRKNKVALVFLFQISQISKSNQCSSCKSL